MILVEIIIAHLNLNRTSIKAVTLAKLSGKYAHYIQHLISRMMGKLPGANNSRMREILMTNFRNLSVFLLLNYCNANRIREGARGNG